MQKNLLKKQARDSQKTSFLKVLNQKMQYVILSFAKYQIGKLISTFVPSDNPLVENLSVIFIEICKSLVMLKS